MATLYLMCGLPGSGKSTYVKENIKDNEVHLSSDNIRMELFGELSQEDNNLVFKTLHEKMWKYLEKGINVWYDATNSSRKKRKHLISEIKRKGYRVEVVFVCPSICFVLENNLTRPIKKQLPNDKLVQMIRSFKVPLKLEGMDKIHIVQKRSSNSDYKLKTVDFDQNNKYHNETLDKHIETVKSQIHEKFQKEDSMYMGFSNRFIELTGDGKILFEVAHYHDLGKPYCQVLREDGQTSYYGHENVSAYIYMSSMPPIFENRFDGVATLIQYHMRINQCVTEKSIYKLIKEIGQENYDLLVEFNKADRYRKEVD